MIHHLTSFLANIGCLNLAFPFLLFKWEPRHGYVVARQIIIIGPNVHLAIVITMKNSCLSCFAKLSVRQVIQYHKQRVTSRVTLNSAIIYRLCLALSAQLTKIVSLIRLSHHRLVRCAVASHNHSCKLTLL